jgi:hypothetical protein
MTDHDHRVRRYLLALSRLCLEVADKPWLLPLFVRILALAPRGPSWNCCGASKSGSRRSATKPRQPSFVREKVGVRRRGVEALSALHV